MHLVRELLTALLNRHGHKLCKKRVNLFYYTSDGQKSLDSGIAYLHIHLLIKMARPILDRKILYSFARDIKQNFTILFLAHRIVEQSNCICRDGTIANGEPTESRCLS